MLLNIEPLFRAVQRLEEGLDRCRQNGNDIQLRDGLVHRFATTYDLSCKILKRYLESTSPNPAQLDRMIFADLVRTANEQGLLFYDWAVWTNFREMRWSSAAAYDEATALQVVQGVPEFLSEIRFLLAQLQIRVK